MLNASAPARPAVAVSAQVTKLVCVVAFLLFTTVPFSSAGEIRFFRIAGPAATGITSFSPEGYVTWTNAVTDVTCTVQAARTLVGADNWVDYARVPVSNHVATLRLFDPKPPVGLALIPAGTFTMGEVNSELKYLHADPPHTVYVSEFYIGVVPVIKGLWDEVKHWAVSNGYDLTNTVYNPKPTNYPVVNQDWFEIIKWCNARSQKEGLTPCYYVDSTLTNVYRTGEVTNPFVDWCVNGYRLPTEAEWEKAARGGLTGKRFPWGDTITHSDANYYSTNKHAYNISYDVSPTRGWHPNYQVGSICTSPVGAFAPNGYGLYDMCGNVFDWCWDWFADYSSQAQTDPRGPDSGTQRMRRGGNWNDNAILARCDYRYPAPPSFGAWGHGFRVVRRHP